MRKSLFLLTLLFLAAHLSTLCAISAGHGFVLTAIHRVATATPGLDEPQSPANIRA